MLFGHGDDLYRYGGSISMNFSSNIYSHADLSGLKAHLAEHLELIGRYPEPEPRELEAMLAEQLGVPRNTLMVTSGATEAIYLIAQLYRGYASIIPQPTFREYADACLVNKHLLSYHDNDTLDTLPENRVYWLCNPNNPTGNVVMKGFLSHLIRTHQQYVYVIDQSYEDYTLAPLLSPKEMLDCQNIFMLHSMTKRFSVPGLRLGYVTAPAILIDRLRALRHPWSVNALAIEAGKYLVSQGTQNIPDLKTYLEEAERLRNMLDAIPGVRTMDTATNFMLAHIEHGSSTELKQWLIKEHSMLIRDASNFHGLNTQYFRVAAQTPKENDLLVQAIAEYMKQKS